MKTVYLLYISAGVALATIFYLYKSHKETMKKIETIQNLVSSIQQVPVMKYNDAEIQSTIKNRCDDIEELIHFVNDEINSKLTLTINTINENNKSNILKQNTTKTNIPKTFFSDFIDPNEINNNDKKVKDNVLLNDTNRSQNSPSFKNINNTLETNLQDNNFSNNIHKNYQNEPILDVENYNDNQFSALSLSSLDKANVQADSVHNSSNHYEKKISSDCNFDANEDLIEKYDLNTNINIDIDLNLDLDNDSMKSKSNNIKQDNNLIQQTNSSFNQSVSDNSKIPKLSELKQIAKSRDLSTNGNKKEIIQRLLDNGYNF